MKYFKCHITIERRYKPMAFPVAPARDCVNYQERHQGRCRVDERPCDARPTGAEKAANKNDSFRR